MLLLLKSKKEVFTILNRLKYLTKLSLIILVLILLVSMATIDSYYQSFLFYSMLWI